MVENKDNQCAGLCTLVHISVSLNVYVGIGDSECHPLAPPGSPLVSGAPYR